MQRRFDLLLPTTPRGLLRNDLSEEVLTIPSWIHEYLPVKQLEG
jgi:hypothetical protein